MCKRKERSHKESSDEFPFPLSRFDLLVVHHDGFHTESTASYPRLLPIRILDLEFVASELHPSSRSALRIHQIPPLADPEPESLLS